MGSHEGIALIVVPWRLSFAVQNVLGREHPPDGGLFVTATCRTFRWSSRSVRDCIGVRLLDVHRTPRCPAAGLAL